MIEHVRYVDNSSQYSELEPPLLSVVKHSIDSKVCIMNIFFLNFTLFIELVEFMIQTNNIYIYIEF